VDRVVADKAEAYCPPFDLLRVVSKSNHAWKGSSLGF
jgi:hypothetical protein